MRMFWRVDGVNCGLSFLGISESQRGFARIAHQKEQGFVKSPSLGKSSDTSDSLFFCSSYLWRCDVVTS